MELKMNFPSKLELVNFELFSEFNIKCYIKRDDLIHAEISGNKWRKLKLNIERFKHGKYERLLTFGGAYSNHISATASLGNALNIPTIGIIRGDELNANSNETLRRAKANGMELHFVSREEYSWRYETDYKHDLRGRFGNVLVVEEGGANFHGVMGCTEIVTETELKPDYYILPVGTGTTATGVLFAAEKAKVIGVAALKNGGFLIEEVKTLLRYSGVMEEELIETLASFDLLTNYSFGGYGRSTEQLVEFMNSFYAATGIALDQVYTAKMMFALCDQIKTGKIPKGSTVVAIHTGGLQGNSSIQSQLNF